MSAPGCWLREVREHLAARGLLAGEPAGGSCMCYFRGLRGVQCEMDLLVTGELVWLFVPLGAASAGEAARVVLALLGGAGPPGGLAPARYPGLAVKDAAGRMLAACGMAVQVTDVRYGDGTVRAEAVVTSPAGPARGHARISDEGTIRWECAFARPATAAGGLAPPAIAGAIAAALAPYTIPGPPPAAGSGPGAAPR